MIKTKFKVGRKYLYIGKSTNRTIDQILYRNKICILNYVDLSSMDNRIHLSILDLYGIYVFKQDEFISYDIDYIIDLKNKILSTTKIKGDINGKSSRRKNKKET